VLANPESLAYLRELIYRRSAIVLDAQKDYLLDSRLTPLVREVGLETIDALVAAVRRAEDAALTRRVVEAITTNETFFFRDTHRTLRIWCAAASTGQEPYSIAMTLRESFPELCGWDVRILATDINASVLERAREGKYRQLEVNRGLPAAMLLKYFERAGAEWIVKPFIREMVSYEELNLLDVWSPVGPQDLVFLRNVLIYFDVETKRRILKRVRSCLKPGGFLVLGGAETTSNLDDGYEPVRIGSGVYYQSKSSSAQIPDVA
jgi:chemotaxis protein methyltransferase CheR